MSNLATALVTQWVVDDWPHTAPDMCRSQSACNLTSLSCLASKRLVKIVPKTKTKMRWHCIAVMQ